MVNLTCNATLEDLRITSENPIVGNFNFHQLGLIVAGSCAAFAIVTSFYLIWMHALHYTKPYEQRHIIRILFMIPVYSTAAFLAFWFYWHAIYYQTISNMYEAFAIASFFALLCHYVAPNLHDQKEYFRGIHPVRGWVWPLTWFRKCCGMDRGPWRTPRSGLTWFNIIWFGIYQYCFVRVSMTIVAVVTQYFGVYCESSNSPWFSHIWVLVLEGASVTVAMFCVIQFYVQLRKDLAPHQPFMKVLAIKLVVFLSFWQTFMISILISSTFNIVSATDTLAYPDLAVGIPSLLLCVEMAIFSVLHVFAYPYKPYTTRAESTKYPISALDALDPGANEIGLKQGGPLGIMAILDAMNPWDLVKAFARGVRWLFVGRRHREKDLSYKINSNDMVLEPTRSIDLSYNGNTRLPIAEEFRRSKFGLPNYEEGAGLIAHAQPNPREGGSPQSRPYTPARQRYDPVTGQEISTGGGVYHQDSPGSTRVHNSQGIGMASSGLENEPHALWDGQQEIPRSVRAGKPRIVEPEDRPQTQHAAHQMLWGPGQAPRSPGQAPRSPGQAPRSPGQAPRSPRQAPRNPRQAPRSPRHAPRSPRHAEYEGPL